MTNNLFDPMLKVFQSVWKAFHSIPQDYNTNNIMRPGMLLKQATVSGYTSGIKFGFRSQTSYALSHPNSRFNLEEFNNTEAACCFFKGSAETLLWPMF